MSIRLYENTLATSPLTGAARAIHMYLAYRANKDGICYPKQQTIADEVKCSVRYVQKVLAQMVELGLIEVSQRACKGNRHEYTVLANPNSGSGSKANSGSGSYREETVEETEEENPPAPAARDNTNDQEQDASMPLNHAVQSAQPPSELDEERKPRKKRTTGARVFTPGTYKGSLHRFHLGAVDIGRGDYSRKHAGLAIADLHNGTGKAQREYSYEEIDLIIDGFFTRHGQHIRADVKDVSLLFKAMLGQVQREAAEAFRYDSSSRQQHHDQAARMWATMTA